MENIIAVPYAIPKDNTAAYYPEADVLVPVASVAYISNIPASKFVFVTIDPVAGKFVKGDGLTEVVTTLAEEGI